MFELEFAKGQAGQGNYAFVTHAFADASKGAVGIIRVGAPKMMAATERDAGTASDRGVCAPGRVLHRRARARGAGARLGDRGGARARRRTTSRRRCYELGTLGVLQSVRGAQGGYRLAVRPDHLRLADDRRAVPAADRAPLHHGPYTLSRRPPCGAHYRWKEVKDTAASFFAELTVADLLASTPQG